MKVLTLIAKIVFFISCVAPAYATSYSELKQQADTLHENGQYSDATSLYKKSFQQTLTRHELITTLAALAVSENKSGNPKNASGFLRRLKNVYPSSKFVKQYSKNSKLKVTNRITSVSSMDTFEKHIQQGNQYYEDNFYDQSVISYLKALSLATSTKEITTSLASLIPSSKCSSDSSSSKIYISRLKKYKKYKKWALKQSKTKAICKTHTLTIKSNTNQCSVKPSYSCDSNNKKAVIDEICSEYFKACDFTKKLNSRLDEYKRENHCGNVAEKLFGEDKHIHLRVDRLLGELSSRSTDIDTGKSTKDSIIRGVVNFAKAATQSELFQQCNKLASETCTRRLTEWRSSCNL